MNSFTISSYLVVFSSISVAIIVFLRGKPKSIGFILGLFCLSVSLWGLSGIFFSSTPNKNTAFLWWRIAVISIVFTPILFYHFVIKFLNMDQKHHKYILYLLYVAGFFYLFLNFFQPSLFYGDLRQIRDQFYWHDWMQNKSIYWILFFLGFYIILLCYIFLLLFSQYKKAVGTRRNQLKYYILGMLLAWLGALSTFTTNFRIPLYPYLNFLVAFYPPIWAYAILKYRLLDIRVAITRVGLFILVYGIILSIPLLLGHRYNQWMMATYLALILASSGPLIFNCLRQRTEQIIFHRQYHYQQELARFSYSFIHITNLIELLDTTLYEIESFVPVSFCAIYLKKGMRYTLQSRSDQQTTLPQNFAETSSLVMAISKSPQPIWAEELPEKPFIRHLSLVCPLLSHQGLIGFILLGEQITGRILDETDKSIFHALSNSLSLALSCFLKK